MFSLDNEYNYDDACQKWCDNRADEFREAADDILGERNHAEILIRALAGAIEDGEVTEFDRYFGFSEDHIACYLRQEYPCKMRENDVKERWYQHCMNCMETSAINAHDTV